MLRYGYTVQKFKSDGLPRSSNGRKTVRSRYETKDFNRKSGRPWILAKEAFNFTLRDIFH